MMIGQNQANIKTAIFITFSGNCNKALTFYRKCFGGKLQFETFEMPLNGNTEKLVISGSLVSEGIIIHGSDLVHEEGRKTGNHLSVFLQCINAAERKMLVEKLQFNKKPLFIRYDDNQKLVEVTDPFDVSWVLSI